MAKKQHYDWWPLVKSHVRKYQDSCLPELSGAELRWREAIKKAIDVTLMMPDGNNHLKVIRLMYWEGTRTLDGAALAIPCDRATAARWQRKFFEEVARNRDLLD